MTGILNILAGSIAAAIKDGYFNLVTLLLPGNGTNGAQNNTFLDSSSNNFTITRNGNTTQGTFSPFSQTGWSNLFDGSSSLQFPSNAALAPGTGDFTIEFWYYRLSDGPLFITSLSGGLYVGALPGSEFGLRAFAVANICSTTTFPAINQWTHIAITRSGTTCRLFYNGVLQQTSTSSQNFVQGNSYLGTDAAGAFSTQYISNFRLVKGTAVYTSNFTPPTSPLTAITNTSLLTCQSNRFVDNSSNAFAITANGTPSVHAFSPFYPLVAYTPQAQGGSGRFDGTGDYLSIADNAALDMGASDFTMECFVYLNENASSADGIFAKRTDINTFGGVLAFINVTTPNFYATVNGSSWGVAISSSISLSLNSWNHLAFTRSGNTWTVWVNGASGGTATVSGTVPDNASAFVVGAYSSDGNATYLFPSGYISNARVVKGTAVYTAAFTPPTAPLTAITNTSLLCNFTNAGITDATAKNDLETVGNAQISTTQSKFGGSSMYFDGTGDYITFPASQNFNLTTGNFTIECWFYYSVTPPSGSDYDYLWGLGTSNTNGIGLYIQGGVPKIWNNSLILTTTGSISATTWYHIAVVRSSGTLTVYLNGTSIGSVSMTSDLSGGASVGFNIARWVNAADVNEFTGYIDDFRITKGYARYTANFSVPTAAFALQ